MILDEIVFKQHDKLAKGSYLFDIVKIMNTFKQIKTESFYNVLEKDGLSIIGEIKKASPSKSTIKEDFDPVEIAKVYDTVVDAISISTEEYYFQGKVEYIEMVHNKTSKPILRNDFIISPIQIFEAKELGASAVLLIVSILDKTTLQEFIKIVHGLQMDALVEVHSEKEIDLALNCGAKIIGINNRDLNDFSEDLNTTVRLSKYIPKNIILVSKGGIKSKDDVVLLEASNVNAILVGESFMRIKDIRSFAKELLRR